MNCEVFDCIELKFNKEEKILLLNTCDYKHVDWKVTIDLGKNRIVYIFSYFDKNNEKICDIAYDSSTKILKLCILEEVKSYIMYRYNFESTNDKNIDNAIAFTFDITIPFAESKHIKNKIIKKIGL